MRVGAWMRTWMIGLGLAAPGCIFFISSEEIGDHCAFRGRETTCGACIAARCQTEVDACCSADACGGNIDLVETCATVRVASAPACERLTSQAAGVGACVKARCPGVCGGVTDGNSKTACFEAVRSDGKGCSCEYGGEVNDFVCEKARISESRCCAPKGWPAAAHSCECNTVQCYPNSEGCVCTLNLLYDGSASTTCQGVHCCAGSDVCTCRSRKCDSFEREVAACGIDGVACSPNRIEVASCSIRSDD